MAIPRNLVYVFACVIVFSFLGMLFIVYTEKDLKQFINYDLGGSGNIIVSEKTVVHPLFQHLKAAITAIDTIPVHSLDQMTPKVFYQEYLTTSIPFIVEDGAADWEALEKWKDLDYISQHFGNKSVSIVRVEREQYTPDSGSATKKKTFNAFEFDSQANRQRTFAQFLNMTRSALAMNSPLTYYIQNSMIVSKNLVKDYTRPMFMQTVLRPRHTGITVQEQFKGRSPQVMDKERYLCVVTGSEEFRLVSPVFKQNIYSGVLDELDPRQSPIDFFQAVNTTRFPLFSEVKLLTAELKAGQCLFIPAFYWVQTKTTSEAPEMTIIMNFEYASHSELMSLLFEAIDKGILEN